MKKNLGTFLAPMIVLALVLGTGAARAAISIANSDFESGTALSPGGSRAGTPTSWSGSSGTVGVYYPVAPTQYGSIPAADGHNFAYIQGTGNIYQNLVVALTAGQILELTFVIGARSDFTPLGTPSANLYENGNGTSGNGISLSQIAVSEVGPVSGSGTMSTWTIDYTAVDSTAGNALQLMLRSTGGTEVDFDNVTLAIVPEPVNMALAMFGILAVGGIAGRRWLASRKNALHPVSVGS